MVELPKGVQASSRAARIFLLASRQRDGARRQAYCAAVRSDNA